MTAAPIAGPVTIGSSTANIMRMPWKCPALPAGVQSRIFAPSAEVIIMYPLIITVPAIITPTLPRTKNMPASPASMTAAAGNTKRSLPSRSIKRPDTTLTTDARISTTPRTIA